MIGVQQQSQQAEHLKDGDEVLLAMATVLLMTAVVLENVNVSIFDPPLGLACCCDGRQLLRTEGATGGEGVAVDALTSIVPMDGRLAPVDM